MHIRYRARPVRKHPDEIVRGYSACLDQIKEDFSKDNLDR